MRTLNLEIQNVANIKNLSLDLEKYGQALIAIVGDNGSGKTHLISSMMATPLFREWPSYGKSGAKSAKQGEGFIDHCTGTHGYIKTCIRYGPSTYTLTLKAQPSIKKQEAYFEVDGELKNSSGRLTEFDSLIAQYFPSSDVIFSAPFATQNAIGSFFRLDRDARRTLFARLLGVEEYEEYAAEAMTVAKNSLNSIAALEELNSNDLEFINHNASIEERNEDINLEISENRDLMERYFKRHFTNARLHHFELDEYTALRDRYQFVEKLRERAWNLESRLAGISPAPTIDSDTISKKVLYVVDSINHLSENIIIPLEGSLRSMQAALRSFDTLLDNTEREYGERKNLFIFRKEQLLKAMQDSRAASISLRSVDLAHPMCSVCPLVGNAVSTVTSHGFSSEQYSQEDSIQRQAVESFEGTQGEAEWIITVIMYTIDRIQADLDRWCLVRETFQYQVDELSAILAQYKRFQQEQDLVQGMWSELEECNCQIEDMRLSDKEEAWYADAAQREEVVLDAQEAILTLDKTISLLHERKTDMEYIIRAISEKREDIKSRSSDIELLRKLVKVHTELSDALLYMRSATIEASRPEVEEVANILLSEYREGRFRIEFSLEPKKNSKDGKEDFSVRIYDTQTGTYRTSGSGGEQAIIDEALRLAFCIVNANRSGSRFEGLFRDETTSALTREHAGSYVGMLRKAQQIGGFHQIVFITHHETVWKQADVILEMNNGELREVANNG